MSTSAQSTLAAALQQSETASTILNIAATAEALAVTLLGAAVAGAANYTNPDGSKGLSSTWLTILKAIAGTEQAHYQFLTGAGAKPLTTSFNIPDPKLATDTMTLWKTVELLDTAFISAYEAAAMEFAEMKQPTLVRYALQIGGTEGEHRALARLAQGDALPHNLAFELAQFATVGDAAAALQKLGFIGGSGQAVTYSQFSSYASTNGVGLTELTPSGPDASITLASGAMPSSMPKTGGVPLTPILVAGAGLAALGARLRSGDRAE